MKTAIMMEANFLNCVRAGVSLWCKQRGLSNIDMRSHAN